MIRSKHSSVRPVGSQTRTYQKVNGENIINTGYADLDCLFKTKHFVYLSHVQTVRNLESEVNSNTMTSN